MNKQNHETDVLIVGGGPAGMAAAYCAAQSKQSIAIVDDNPNLGGQIWRGELKKPTSVEATVWLKRVQQTRAAIINGVRIIAQPEANVLLAETIAGGCQLRYRKLILATGARERFLPFPGWTLPNVFGAGGLQALVKSGLSIAGKKVIVSGSGPLLLAVADYLQKEGAKVLLIAEQAAPISLFKFGLGLIAWPQKIFQAIKLRRDLAGVPYLTNCWIEAAQGEDKLTGVIMRRGNRRRQIECDYLACGFHLLPNVELAALLGCELSNGCVRVDDYQQTSAQNIFCVGESTGIGGLELSLVEGQIAGFAAGENYSAAKQLWAERKRAQRFAEALNRAFALRPELKELAQADTIVCRCEDATFETLQQRSSWREAKLHTRCGMGPCQGRICGGATEFLFGWQTESTRPPVFPCQLETLTTNTGE